MKTKLKLHLTAFAVIMMTACSGSGSDEPGPGPTPPTPARVPINLSLGVTRATDTSFETGDRVGLYVVNYNGSAAGTLAVSGNYATNQLFSYNGTWQTATQLYWKDEQTHADFYAYYPYQQTVSSVTAMPFNVPADQTTEAAYKGCDLLWGKTADVAPTPTLVSIMTRHLMSGATIRLTAGEGFTAETLAAANPVVTLNNVRTAATLNLSTGQLTATGTTTAVSPLKRNGEWVAMVPPQTATATGFITVSIDGRDYRLNKEHTFQSGMRYTFTVTVNRTSNGINVGITDWETDPIDYGGVAE